MGISRRGVILGGGSVVTLALGGCAGLDLTGNDSDPGPTHRTVEHVTVPNGMATQPFEIPIDDGKLRIEIEPTADVDAWVAERSDDNPAKSLAPVGCQVKADAGDRAAAECRLPSDWYNVVLQSGEKADVRLVIELYAA